ncbi:Uncharacterized protein F36G3.2 [Exaiptasia diaphana]|nr:Uncharacterized protein F36G3.2 [Exaiptasia diaphana]
MAELEIHEIRSNDISAIFFINETMASEKWQSGLEDTESLLCGEHPGVYIGELNGKPIATVCFSKYGNAYSHFGFYLVDKKYRGMGYGMKIFSTVFKDINSSQNISAYSVPNMVEKYEIHGFRAQWLCLQHKLDMPKTLEILKAIPSNQNGLTSTKNTNNVHQETLLRYDTAVFGYQRHSFLIKLLHAKGSHVKVAVNSDGAITGYAVARVAYRQQEGYILGPLFADSVEAAKVLLAALFEEMLSHGLSSSSPTAIINCPCSTGRNSNSMRLMEQLEGKNTGHHLVYITTKGVPLGLFDKWFGIASPV